MVCIKSISALCYIGDILSASLTFQSCIRNIPDAAQIPTMGYSSGVQPLNLLAFVDLQQIIQSEGSLKIDMFLTLQWEDHRFSMPLLWDNYDDAIKEKGIKIELENENNNNFWLPEIYLKDSKESSVLKQSLFLNSSNIFSWKKHIKASFSEDYRKEKEKINVKLQSFDYDTSLLNITTIESIKNQKTPLKTNQNADKTILTQFENGWELFIINDIGPWVIVLLLSIVVNSILGLKEHSPIAASLILLTLLLLYITVICYFSLMKLKSSTNLQIVSAVLLALMMFFIVSVFQKHLSFSGETVKKEDSTEETNIRYENYMNQVRPPLFSSLTTFQMLKKVFKTTIFILTGFLLAATFPKYANPIFAVIAIICSGLLIRDVWKIRGKSIELFGNRLNRKLRLNSGNQKISSMNKIDEVIFSN